MLSTDAFEDRFLAFRTTRDVQAMLALAVQTGDANLDALTVPGAAVAGFADVGLRPNYVGGLDAAATVDGMARLWFALAFGQGRQFAVKLLAE